MGFKKRPATVRLNDLDSYYNYYGPGLIRKSRAVNIQVRIGGIAFTSDEDWSYEAARTRKAQVQAALDGVPRDS